MVQQDATRQREFPDPLGDRPRTVNSPTAPPLQRAAGRSHRGGQLPGVGVFTAVAPAELLRRNSDAGQSAISSPAADHHEAVRGALHFRHQVAEPNTARPSAASDRISSRIQRIPSGQGRRT
jgi:hypothetical protein